MAVRAQFRCGGGLPRLPAGGEGGCGAHSHMKMKGGGGRRGQWRRQPMVFKGRCSDMGRGWGPAWGVPRGGKERVWGWYDAGRRREGGSSQRQDPGTAAPGRVACRRRLDREGLWG
jgi:hypothetical protein